MDENFTDEKRRRILKGAALTAPIIATLPCGSVLANASTNQCIIRAEEQVEMQGEKNIGALNPVKIARGEWQEATPDEYLRARVPFGVLKDRENDDFRVTPAYQLQDRYFDSDGNKYTGDSLKFKEKGHAFVAIVFRPNDDKSDAEVVGLWPEESLSVGNTPLNGSCWTSISPNSTISYSS